MDEGTILVYCCPSTFSLTSPLPKLNVQYKQTVCSCGGGGVLNCAVDHILQEFSTLTLVLTRFRAYKIASLPLQKWPVKTTLRDWCLYSSFVHGGDDRPPYKYATLAWITNFNGTTCVIFSRREKVCKPAPRRDEFEPARKVRESQLQTEMEITKNKNPQATIWIFFIDF